MRSRRSTENPRVVVAGLWAVSMLVSWVGGTLLIGFDPATTLIWLVLTLLGPILVWAFVAAAR